MAKLGQCNNNGGYEFCCVNDSVCVTVELGDLVRNVPFVFYRNTSGFTVNGTVVVTNNELGDDVGTTVELVVNGVRNPNFIVEPGDSKSFTLNNILTLALEAVAGFGTENTANVNFSVNYKF